MEPWWGRPTNASASHREGRAARIALDDARDVFAELLGVDRGRVVFTSGGTESDNLAIHNAGGPLLVSAVEHPAVMVPATEAGATLIGVDRHGVVDLDHLAHLLDAVDAGDAGGADRSAALVAVMAVNNEIGTIQPIAEVAEIVAGRARLHCDAVQAMPWLDLRPIGGQVDFLAISAHKFGGPQGIGVAVVPEPVVALVRGGHQERDRRAGTQPVASAVGMAAAAAATDADRHVQVPRVAALAGRLVDAATRWGASETVPAERRTAGHVHLRFAGLDAEALLFLLDEGGVAASAASACASGAQQASSVVEALGVDPTGSVRFSLGHSTTDAEIDHAIAVIDGAVGRLR